MPIKSIPFSALVVISAVTAALAGLVMRFGIIEHPVIGEICGAAAVSWPCEARSQMIFALMHTPTLGLVALTFGLVALFGNWRTLIIAAVVTGACGLFLYNATLCACGLMLGAIAALRH